MSPIVGFLLFLALTLAGLAGTFFTGMRALRKRHLTLVATTVLLLATTIYYAERLGEGLDVRAAGWITDVHLFIAKLTVAAYLAPVITGVSTIRNGRFRKVHGKVAWTVLGLTVLTAVTGTWMVIEAPALATTP